MFRKLLLIFATLPCLTFAHPSDFPTRDSQINQIEDLSFDILVIGGGATGAGVALDAATRGLKVLLVEKQDFSSQTSSRCTKLIHGGVRYLEKTVLNFDRKQYMLVKEALKERGILFHMAPYCVYPVRIITPIYKFWQLPYMWLGLKLYDFISGSASIEPSRYISSENILKECPSLKSQNLKGGVVYYDGQFVDTRFNIMAIQTAISNGALATNYMEVTDLLKENGKLVGATLYDHLNQRVHRVKSKLVINATGPFSDRIRKMDDKGATALMRPSSGTHLLLDQKFTPHMSGILIPKTDDGRVLFMLPWQGSTILGTTDSPAPLSEDSLPSKEDIPYLLTHISKYLDQPINEEDIKSMWSGLRPLVQDPNVSDTSKLSRNHIIEVSSSGLLSIMGGKWTTFRKMAEDVVDRALEVGQLQAEPCKTEELQLIGSSGYSSNALEELRNETNLDIDICAHLLQSYGMLAFDVVNIGPTERLHTDYPYIYAELLWAVEREYAQSISDVLNRRIPLGLIDARAAISLAPTVSEIMRENLSWDDLKNDAMLLNAQAHLNHFLP